MADLDAELLALAGGDDSSAEETFSPPKQKSPLPQRSNKQIRNSPPADMARKGTARVTKKIRTSKNDSDDGQA